MPKQPKMITNFIKNKVLKIVFHRSFKNLILNVLKKRNTELV